MCRTMGFITAGWVEVYTGAIVASAKMRAISTKIGPAERQPLTVLFRLLERDERVFAVLLTVGMVGGLATLGLFTREVIPGMVPVGLALRGAFA